MLSCFLLPLLHFLWLYFRVDQLSISVFLWSIALFSSVYTFYSIPLYFILTMLLIMNTTSSFIRRHPISSFFFHYAMVWIHSLLEQHMFPECSPFLYFISSIYFHLTYRFGFEFWIFCIISAIPVMPSTFTSFPYCCGRGPLPCSSVCCWLFMLR